jgi:hypothetical protein
MEDQERKALAERLHSYSGMPGIPEQVQNDLIQASVLIYANQPEEPEKKTEELQLEEPISKQFMGANGFDHIGYANEILRRYGNLDFNSSGVDPRS